MFSGGRDSSLAVCLLAQAGYEVTLLTTSAGASLGEDLVKYRVEELRRAVPGQDLPWKQVSTPGLFRSVALADIERDFARWKTNLVLLGGQIASLTEGIVTCLNHGWTQLATGYAKYEHEYMEQDPVAVDRLRAFCGEFGIELLMPVYDYTSVDHVKYSLLNFGVSTKSLESVSLFGDTFSPANPDAIAAYIDDKLDVCRSYVMLKTTGRDESPMTRTTSRHYIHKVGAAIVDHGKLLVVRKRNTPRKFIIPGGKPEGIESHEETLKRELEEELGVEIDASNYLGSFEDIAEFEEVPIRMDIYDVTIDGEPEPRNEIAELCWVDRNYEEAGVHLGSVLTAYVIPRLIQRGLM